MKTEKKSERTQIHIMDSYIELIDKKPFDRISVKEVVERAGITRSTFYTYFEDIYDLIQTIEDLLTTWPKFNYDINAFNTTGKKEDSNIMIENQYLWFHFCKDHRKQFIALLGENGDPYFTHKIRISLEKHFNEMMDADGFPDDELRPFFVTFLAAANIGVLLYWLKENANDIITSRQLAYLSNSLRKDFISGSTDHAFKNDCKRTSDEDD